MDENAEKKKVEEIKKILAGRDYFSRLEQEIVKLMESAPFLRNAQFLNLAFNGPRGDARDIMLDMIERHKGVTEEKTPYEYEWVRSRFDAAIILPIKKSKPIVILKRLGRNLSQFSITIDPEDLRCITPVVNSYLVCWKGELWGEMPWIVYKNYPRVYINSLFFLPYSFDRLKTEAIELPLKLLLGESRMKLKDSQMLKDARECLRKLGVLPEKRGKNKKKKPIKLEMEDFLQSEARKGIRRDKKIPSITELLDRLEKYLSCKYPDTEHTLPSFATVSRILKRANAR